jgi:ribosomal silencing factor RsfS
MAEAAKSGQRPYKTAGLESSQWIVADFVDVVVHLFDEAHRKYYDLELIWGDAPRLRWRRRTPALVQEGREDEPTG